MPRYFDSTLTPAVPLDETGRGKRSFDARAAGVSKSTPTQIVPARPKPVTSAKPFNPGSVTPPVQPVKKASAKPFAPDALQRPEPVQTPVTVQRPSARPFSPEAAAPPKPTGKPFSLDALTPPARPAKKVSAKPFAPDALQRPEPVQTPVTVQRPSARPFSPEAVTVHAAPTPPANTLREFDPSHITPDTDD